MYSNVLIISDNLEMALFFKELVDSNKCYDGFNFTISISPYSDQREFADVLNTNILVYNLNNKSHIETIISRYSLVLSMHCN